MRLDHLLSKETSVKEDFTVTVLGQKLEREVSHVVEFRGCKAAQTGP